MAPVMPVMDIQRQALAIAAMALVQQAHDLTENIPNQKDRTAVTDAILNIGKMLYDKSTRGS